MLRSRGMAHGLAYDHGGLAGLGGEQGFRMRPARGDLRRGYPFLVTAGV